MSLVACQFKIDEMEKANAFSVIESYGLTPSQVLRSFLIEIGQTKAIPLSLNYQKQNTPNRRTAQLLRNIESSKEPMEQFDSVEDLLKDLAHASN